MKKIIVAICLMVLSSCGFKGKEETEKGYIVEKQYFPDTRQTVTGTGFSSSGDMVFTSHNIGQNEKFMVIFKCEHGVIFTVNDMDAYANLNRGDSVRIHYCKIYNHDSEVVDYDFLYAGKLNNYIKK